MDVKLFIAIIAFVFISYSCFIHFSESVENQLLKHLQNHFDDVECPGGISLYRLQRNGVLFRVQIQSRLPQSPNVKHDKIRRCEATKMEMEFIPDESHSTKTCIKETRIDDIGRNCSRSAYLELDTLTSRLLHESCDKVKYETQECRNTHTKYPGCSSNYQQSSGFVSYLLEVVKGPPEFETADYKTKSEIWSIETLTKGIFPGTLWCGFGNIADDTYGKLGEHSETDNCCRSHDLCKPIIKAFQTRYWYSNPSIVPISHCACDMEFYNCLLRVNSPTSKMIGKIFFNLVKMKCFDFDVREVCSSTFMGLCLKREDKCVAVIKMNKRFPD